MTTWGDRMDDAARAAGSIPWGMEHRRDIGNPLGGTGAQVYRDRAFDRTLPIANAIQRAAHEAGGVARELAVMRETLRYVENALRAEHVDETTILRVQRRVLTGSPDAPEPRAEVSRSELLGEWRNPEGWPR